MEVHVVSSDFGAWDDLLLQLGVCAGVYVVFSTVVTIGNRYYGRALIRAIKKDKDYWLQRVSRQLLGSPGDAADKHVARNQPPLFLALNFVQYVGSALTVALWISKSYTLEQPSTVQKIFGVSCCAFYITFSVLEVVRNQFRLSEIRQLGTFTDLLSTASLITALTYQEGWLSLAYLRVYNAHVSFQRLVRSSKFMSDFQSACLLTLSKFIALMTICASTMFVAETLGDIPKFNESGELATRNLSGDPISFFIMLYYSFVTISTVGYGDFFPESALGRLLAIFMIFGGILFFTKETTKILELSKLLMNGKGSYKTKGGHVIVTGGAVDVHNLRVFRPFVEELCHPDRGEERPKILMVSANLMSQEVRRFVTQWWAVNFIKFLQGSLVSEQDMERTSLKNAKLVYVVCPFHSLCPSLCHILSEK